MVLNYDFQNTMLWKYLIFRRYEVKALWFWKRIIFGISDKIWFWVLKWYRIHGYEMECLFWFLKYNLFLNDRGVIITMGWQRDRDRIWTYSLSIPKTTLITIIRGVLIQNEVDGLVNALTEERERYWMTPDMTKTGAAPGHWGSPPLADTLLRYHIYYICDAIWVHPLIWECCFAVLG